MSYCKNCGHKISEEQQFCPECGKQVEAESIPPMVGNEAPQPALKGMSRKTKMLTISAAAIAALTFGAYYMVNKTMTSPSAVVDNFIEAVQKQDVKTVKKIVNEGQIELKANEKQVQQFLTYVKDNPQVLASMSDELKEEVSLYETQGNTVQTDEVNSSYAQLKLDGKKWILFDHYTIRVQPAYAEVTSNLEKADVYIDNQKVGTIKDADESQTVGPFLPGEHEMKLSTKGDYGTVEMKQTIESTDSDEEISVDFDWGDHYVSLYSDYFDGTVFVNGKSTGKTVEELGYIGPVNLDGSVEVHAERKFGSKTKKTPAITLEGDIVEAELYFSMSDDFDDVSTEVDASDSIDEETDIEDAVRSHYNYITSDSFASAHDLFSSSRKSKVDLSDWKKGLQANISDNVTNIEVLDVDGNEARAYVEMTSYDDNNDGTHLVQEWEGYWSLVKEDGEWKLDSADLEKVDSRVE
ncbi:zinc ribbon domain-containing protein [Priestia flexa]|uniref:zinc ribbon domain-containing protein n=1 Tax=Priestia flexa TaxID=86664 RepID=UPI001CD4D71B|nr:zinc-ribbon domain-containing protein [Priestia flexa]MCA1202250.1 zinc-ribbon domain-containing protein [Priestia flexa]